MMFHRLIHYARLQWQIWQAWRKLRAQHQVAQMPLEEGFIRSRPLSQRDVIECCNWVLANCSKSIRARPSLSAAVATSERTRAYERIIIALQSGRSEQDDWAIMPLRFVLEDASERTLFKLTWG